MLFGKIRKRFTYANVLMTLALVFAMTGGAYAAKKYLITSTKQISPSVLKALAGKTGPAGPAGAPGANGKDGLPGSTGKDGAPGIEGKEGPQGKEGKEGKQGIQGIEGKEGKEGSPWTAGGTLPSGQTETGVWERIGGGGQFIPISFNIPLASALAASQFHVGQGCAIPKAGEPFTEGCEVHIIQTNGQEKVYNEETEAAEEQPSPVCHGTSPSPSANPGNLCVYITFGAAPFGIANPASSSGASGASKAGASIFEGTGEADGTWAVTAP